MDLQELSRIVENLIRFGTIHSVDHPAKRVRVQTGNLVTNWLRWMEYRAGETTTWDPPTVGEQCVVFSPSGELAQGIVFYGAPSDVIDTPSHDPNKHVTLWPDGTEHSYDHAEGLHQTTYPDGAIVSYHHPSSHLQAINIKTGLCKATQMITFDTPLVHITGMCVVDQLLTYNNGLTGFGGTNGSQIEGDIWHRDGTLLQTNVDITHQDGVLVQSNIDQTNTGGKITDNGITLHDHYHTDVWPGPSTTGQPVGAYSDGGFTGGAAA